MSHFEETVRGSLAFLSVSVVTPEAKVALWPDVTVPMPCADLSLPPLLSPAFLLLGRRVSTEGSLGLLPAPLYYFGQ